MHRIYYGDDILENGHQAELLLRKDGTPERYKNNVPPTGHKNRLSNPRNLFDDVNSEDSKWIKIAQGYLRGSIDFNS